MNRLPQLAIICLLIACADSAAAQGIAMLNPIAPRYTLLGFVYVPPKGDGWRELASQADGVHLVYAEQLDGEQINTRADFTVLSSLIDEPGKVPDALTLTGLSMNQRLEEKKQETGTEVVGISRPQQLAGPLSPFEYEIRLKVADEEVFEDYFIALAPDKTQYLAAKLVTKDKDFRELPYFKSLQESITGLTFSSAAPAEPSAKEAAAPESSDSAASPSTPSPKPADTAPAPPGVK